MTGFLASIEQPEELLRELGQAKQETFGIAIPVSTSSQEPRDVAGSIRDGIFICESLAAAFNAPSISIERHPSDPNASLIVLKDTLANPDIIRDFVTEWRDTLDPDGDREPFTLTSVEAERLFDRLDSSEPSSAFRFPELVNWFRDVRADFDLWDFEEDDDGDDRDE